MLSGTRRRRLLAPLLAPLLTVGALAASALAVGPAAEAGVVSPAPIMAAPLPASALECHGDFTNSKGTPVLLVPGTTLTPEEFRWNYMKQFTAAGRAWCAVTLPDHAMADAQTAGEYVAGAIRATYAKAGRRISVIGHSQGGMVPRWALKYFPDTRAMVDDLIGLAPSNHGTLDAYPVCALGGCAPSIWQQQTGSHFLAALNAGQETYAGISYTQVYTLTDEVVTPNLPAASSSSLSTGPGAISNVAVQQVCPTEISDHLSLGTSDPVGYALALDALNHTGPAAPARISPTVCLQGIAPGIDPLTFPANFAAVVATAGTQIATYPHVAAEPPLKPYAK